VGYIPGAKLTTGKYELSSMPGANARWVKLKFNSQHIMSHFGFIIYVSKQIQHRHKMMQQNWPQQVQRKQDVW